MKTRIFLLFVTIVISLVVVYFQANNSSGNSLYPQLEITPIFETNRQLQNITINNIHFERCVLLVSNTCIHPQYAVSTTIDLDKKQIHDKINLISDIYLKNNTRLSIMLVTKYNICYLSILNDHGISTLLPNNTNITSLKYNKLVDYSNGICTLSNLNHHETFIDRYFDVFDNMTGHEILIGDSLGIIKGT